MTHKIAASLMGRAVPVEDLIHLPDNPRHSDTEALAESYDKFGQLKTLIGVPADGGKTMIVSGNHQLRAARDELGWSHVAVDVHEDLSEEQIAAFIVLENHWGNIGDVDDAATLALINDSGADFIQMFDMVGYDEMALASLENVIIMSELKDTVDPNAGWIPPVILEPLDTTFAGGDTPLVGEGDDDDEIQRPVVTDVSTEDIVTQGSGAVAPGSETKKAVIQYTLVFEDDSQQKVWYDFIRWVRSSPVYDGDTTAALLLEFIKTHSEIG